jgi:hypothetical protein
MELNNGASLNTMDKWTRSTTRSQISTPNCDHNSFGKPETLQPSQLVPTTNRFSILAKLPDPTAEIGGTPSESKGTIDGLNHYHSYKRKQQQERKNIRNKANNHHVRTSTQQPNEYQIPWCEPKDQVNTEKEPNLTSRKHHSNPRVNTSTNVSVSAKVNHNITQHIPTIVNGEVSAITSNRVKLLNADNEGNMQNLMTELKMELTNN